MFKKFVFLSVLGLFTISSNAFASTRSVDCHGCSDLNMANAATQVATIGTDIIFVFNYVSKEVKKFQVFTYKEDTRPFTIVKEAIELSVDTLLANSYKDVVNDAIQNDGREIVMPPTFPIKSSAGALQSPSTAMGYINQHLENLSWMETTKLNMSRFFANLMDNLIPIVDIDKLIQHTMIVVKFPDGSVQMYKITFMFNLNNSEIEYVSSPIDGTATDQDGNPIPATPQEFMGKTFEDINSSLSDWVEYARELNLTISGTQQPGGVMICYSPAPGHLVCELQMP